jgi:hypothetical protein
MCRTMMDKKILYYIVVDDVQKSDDNVRQEFEGLDKELEELSLIKLPLHASKWGSTRKKGRREEQAPTHEQQNPINIYKLLA